MKADGLKALVIGCGRIGAAWDSPTDTHVLTHAHAYRAHPRIASLAFVDADPASAKRAAERWGGTAFDSLESALRDAPDIASVCVPDVAHAQVLSRLLDSRTRLILAEKPLTTSVAESAALVARARALGKLVNVNYSRRFDPTVAEARAALRRGDHGRPLNAVAYYTKGILHNGSHIVDLLRHLLGEVVESRPLAGRAGYGPDDPTLDCWLRSETCPSIHLVALDEDRYSIVEVDILCEKGRIRFTRFGYRVETQGVRDDPMYPGYRELTEDTPRDTGFASALSRYLENGLAALESGRELLCPAEDALKTQKTCADLLAAFLKEKDK